MKITHHNGRSGKNGAYNPKHNDREFDLEHSEHIDEERARQNIYWDCFQGFRTGGALLPEELLPPAPSEDEPDPRLHGFEKIEEVFYYTRYNPHVEAQNERNLKSRHTERNRTTKDILSNPKTCPEESLLQIGNIDESVSPDVLFLIANEFYEELDRRYGEYFHVIDWALHMDESTPHIHERHVFDCPDSHGDVFPQQEKALTLMGFELPYPDKKPGKYNNRKMVFDATCRDLLFEIAAKYQLEIDKEPTYGGRKYLEKKDYIIEKQNEALAEKSRLLEEKAAELTTLETKLSEKEADLEDVVMKLSDLDSFAKEVANNAYDKACDVVTQTVTKATRDADIKAVSDYKKWFSTSKNSESNKSLGLKIIEAIETKLQKLTGAIAEKVTDVLHSPKVKSEATKAIAEEAKDSIRGKLNKYKSMVNERNANAPKQATKNNSHELS